MTASSRRTGPGRRPRGFFLTISGFSYVLAAFSSSGPRCSAAAASVAPRLLLLRPSLVQPRVIPSPSDGRLGYSSAAGNLGRRRGLTESFTFAARASSSSSLNYAAFSSPSPPAPTPTPTPTPRHPPPTAADDGDGFRSLLSGAGLIEPLGGEILRVSPLSEGFCNRVFMCDVLLQGGVGGEGDHRRGRIPRRVLVAKIFSPMAAVRVPPHLLGLADLTASDRGVGPRVLYRSSRGLVMEYVEGVGLTEDDVLGGPAGRFGGGGSDLCRALGRALGIWHSTPPPPPLRITPSPGASNVLWTSLDAMLRFLGHDDASLPPGVRRDGWTISRLRDGARSLREDLDGLGDRGLLGPIVMGHGDFKPANVLVRRRDGPEAAGEPPGAEASPRDEDMVLIDLELSGPNYRGYDVCKMFRGIAWGDDGPAPQNARAFAASYLEAFDAASASVATATAGGTTTANGKEETATAAEAVALLLLQARLFESLTVSPKPSVRPKYIFPQPGDVVRPLL